MATFEVTLSSADEAYVRQLAASLGVSVPAAVAIVVEEQRCQKLRANNAAATGHPVVPIANSVASDDTEVAANDPIFSVGDDFPADGPSDLSVNYKHYLYGFPKRSQP